MYRHVQYTQKLNMCSFSVKPYNTIAKLSNFKRSFLVKANAKKFSTFDILDKHQLMHLRCLQTSYDSHWQPWYITLNVQQICTKLP